MGVSRWRQDEDLLLGCLKRHGIFRHGKVGYTFADDAGNRHRRVRGWQRAVLMHSAPRFAEAITASRAQVANARHLAFSASSRQRLKMGNLGLSRWCQLWPQTSRCSSGHGSGTVVLLRTTVNLGIGPILRGQHSKTSCRACNRLSRSRDASTRPQSFFSGMQCWLDNAGKLMKPLTLVHACSSQWPGRAGRHGFASKTCHIQEYGRVSERACRSFVSSRLVGHGLSSQTHDGEGASIQEPRSKAASPRWVWGSWWSSRGCRSVESKRDGAESGLA
ncbi:hypothetical protein IQ06DRAFT_40425 [Phaeosphaeriaceae sp. SRC1lsM3a]|nr:hypothetical protein IQ06DRAFT_40425 [Stagonospora sp. SRC1lsM3a]